MAYTVTDSSIFYFLSRDFDNKKTFDARFKSECDLCSSEILTGDEFVFGGQKEKICMICVENIRDFMEKLGNEADLKERPKPKDNGPHYPLN